MSLRSTDRQTTRQCSASEVTQLRLHWAMPALLASCGVVFLGLIMTVSANAGGIYTNEFSTTSQGNAGAGRGAWVPDASASLHNPASMTELDDHGFATGISIVAGKVRFDPDRNSPSGTANGGNQVDAAALASFSYAHKVSDRLRFGLSFYSLSGSILDPNDGYAGRFEMIELSLLTITIAPSIAIRLTDWLSIGGGPLANYGVLDWNLKQSVGLNERRIKLDNLDDWEPSGRVGLFIKPVENVALSIYYNSETEFNLSGDINGPTGVSRSFSSDLPFAQFIEISGHWQATEELALLATFNWEDWSSVDNLDVTVAGRQTTALLGLEDTYKIGVGANYQLDEKWLLQTGITFDSSAFKNKNRSTVLPIDQQLRFSLGTQYDVTRATTLGLSFTYVNLGQGEIRNPTVRGDYQDNDLFIFGVTLAFKKLPWSGKLTLAGNDS